MGNQLKEFISIMLIKTYDKIQLNHPGEVAILDKNMLFIANSNGNSPLIQVRYRDSLKTLDTKESKLNKIEEKKITKMMTIMMTTTKMTCIKRKKKKKLKNHK